MAVSTSSLSNSAVIGPHVASQLIETAESELPPSNETEYSGYPEKEAAVPLMGEVNDQVDDSPPHEVSEEKQKDMASEKCADATIDGIVGKLPADIEQHINPRWGRFNNSSWAVSLGCLGIMTICPVLVILGWIALSSFRGSLFDTLSSLFKMGLVDFVLEYAPRPTAKATIGYCVWLAFQAGLYEYLPSRVCFGQRTPAGHLLPYKVNGLLAWIVTHALAVLLSVLGLLDPAFVAKNWEGLIIALNVYGFLLPAFAYFKAHWAPSHHRDRKFSGSRLYDFYMGVELNPRLGKWWDFKLFHNGRPGIVAWTLIDLSFAAWQYELHGYVSNSMVIVNLLHAFYVVDFFVNEDWYLRTIDISHDHFGFYLAWGSIVWLPTTYTLQAQYLARYPLNLSTPVAAAVLATGTFGYLLFRMVNYQKDIVRRTGGKCKIWGQKAKIIKAKYVTEDGSEHESLLLCSGWWGVVRHANYLGDLIFSYSVCAAAGLGFKHILPWWYAIFMTWLLLHRACRDHERCTQKYGEYWLQYCQRVRYRLIPGVY